MELSDNLVSVVPLAEVNEIGSSTVQLAVTFPPVARPSQNVLRSSVVTDIRKRPSKCSPHAVYDWSKVKVRRLPSAHPMSDVVWYAAVCAVPSCGSIAQPSPSAVVPLIVRATEKSPPSDCENVAVAFCKPTLVAALSETELSAQSTVDNITKNFTWNPTT